MQTASQRPDWREASEFGQVLQFPQRRTGTPPISGVAASDLAREPFDALARYEEDEPLNDGTRMLMNVIGVGIATFLVAAGVWVADVISDVDRIQDCVMQGRINCAPIQLPIPNQQ
jgi:hypothetical protein